MATATLAAPASRPATRLNERLAELVQLHFHPEHGSRYWLRRQAALGWDVRDRVRTLHDLWFLGPTPTSDLRMYPLLDFIPRGLHGQQSRLIVGETAGTSDQPCLTVYRDDEFQAAFVTPFLRSAVATGFPHGESWLWVGPSGPHIMGKAVRELARQTGSMDPFSIDFDRRWARRLADGSLARQQYLDHVLGQALDVLLRENVAVVAATPPLLTALARRMTDRQREAIRGILYGGTGITPEAVNSLRDAFPGAVHLSGYGNTLFGALMEVADKPRRAMDYYSQGDRLQFNVVNWREGRETGGEWPPVRQERGQVGRVVFDRLDETLLLVGVALGDDAERVAPSPEALYLGCLADGLRNPRRATDARGVPSPGLFQSH